MKPLLTATLLLTACSASSTPSAPLETPFQVSVVVHCGVEFSTFEYEGSRYRMQARNQAETETSPRGWSGRAVITIIEDDGRLLAIGPDGSERELIPVSPRKRRPDSASDPISDSRRSSRTFPTV